MNNGNDKLELTLQSLETELETYKKHPFNCLYEYIWNSFDAGATEVRINYTLPEFGNVEEVKIEDNGSGWNFEKEKNTKTFLSSTKKSNENKKLKKSLPRGKYGRGRYVFIWIAEKLEVFSSNQKLVLDKSTYVKPEKSKDAPAQGTVVYIKNLTNSFSDILKNEECLSQNIAIEFCWLLKENDKYKIFINNKQIDINFNILSEKDYDTQFLIDNDINISDNSDFKCSIVVWKDKPSEWSSFFFLDDKQNESYTKATGMNKQKDKFYHSVYISSNFFTNQYDDTDDSENELPIYGSGKQKEKLLKALRQELVDIRKPFLKKNSLSIVKNLEEEKAFDNLIEMGVYDIDGFKDLIKVAYTIAPSLFVGRDIKEQRFICSTFAGLLSSSDKNIIKIVLEQLQELSEEEKESLLDILQRTTLSNIVKTIKEIDHRIEVIENLKKLIGDFKKETLEVKHLQKILDDNFWVFGEQFKLVSSTEGSIKKVLYDYAKKFLNIKNPEITTSSKKELDLFITKELLENEHNRKNIIVELKRPAITLGEKEYGQIKKYCEEIMKNSLCNGENMFWEFYLIGTDYDEHIINEIEDKKHHGEKQKGLTFNIRDGKAKIYVRKWSDILNVEWEHKLKYLKEKLQIESKSIEYKSPQEIVDDTVKK